LDPRTKFFEAVRTTDCISARRLSVKVRAGFSSPCDNYFRLGRVTKACEKRRKGGEKYTNRTVVRNNACGHANHSFFWLILGPNARGSPKGKLAQAISSQFGSFDQFEEKAGGCGSWAIWRRLGLVGNHQSGRSGNHLDVEPFGEPLPLVGARPTRCKETLEPLACQPRHLIEHSRLFEEVCRSGTITSRFSRRSCASAQER
jgi:hypothetical protein